MWIEKKKSAKINSSIIFDKKCFFFKSNIIDGGIFLIKNVFPNFGAFLNVGFEVHASIALQGNSALTPPSCCRISLYSKSSWDLIAESNGGDEIPTTAKISDATDDGSGKAQRNWWRTKELLSIRRNRIGASFNE